MLRRVPAALAELSIVQLWRRIEARIEALAPALMERIAPPATDAELEALELALGQPLPTDYVASLREHAGWRRATKLRGDPHALTLVAGFTLLPPQVVLAERSWLTEGYRGPACEFARLQGPLRPARYDPGWLPVVQHDEDRALYSCVDLVPAEGGRYGQIVSMCTNDPDHLVAWSSFRELLAGELLVRLEHGELDQEALHESGILVLEDP